MTVAVRYIVDSVAAALPFYRDQLGFTVDMHPAPGFAALSLDGAKLFLNQPGFGGAGQSDSAGRAPAPGGWNRIQIVCADLDAAEKRLRDGGATFRSGMILGNGGRQILVEDPSGNLVELFEPKR